MKVSEALQEARAKIEVGWTQKVGARDANGNPCIVYEDVARSWCASGAIATALDLGKLGNASMGKTDPEATARYERATLTRNKAEEFLVKAIDALTYWSVPSWNDRDERTKEEVLAAFDKAIVLAIQDETHTVEGGELMEHPIAETVSLKEVPSAT